MPTASVNGIDICYDTRGSGPALLLVMGLGSQLIHWREDFCDLLADRGFRVIRFDNRDTGLSTHMHGASPPSVRQMGLRRILGLPIDAPYQLEDMADDAAALLDHLDIERASVVGASMGGMIAQTLTIRHPERVARLVSIMSHTGNRRFLIGKPAAMRALLGPSASTADEAEERLVTVMRAIGSPAYPTDEHLLREVAREGYERSHDPAGFGRQMAAILASGSRAAALREIEQRSLVIHGTADPLVIPAGGRATAAAIPQAELEEIDGMGHDLPRPLWGRLTTRIADFCRGA